MLSANTRLLTARSTTQVIPFMKASTKAKIILKLLVKTSNIAMPVEILESVYMNLITEIGDTLSEIVPMTIPKRLIGNILAAKIIVTKYGNPSSWSASKLKAKNSMARAIPVIQPAPHRILKSIFLKHFLIIEMLNLTSDELQPRYLLDHEKKLDAILWQK